LEEALNAHVLSRSRSRSAWSSCGIVGVGRSQNSQWSGTVEEERDSRDGDTVAVASFHFLLFPLGLPWKWPRYTCNLAAYKIRVTDSSVLILSFWLVLVIRGGAVCRNLECTKEDPTAVSTLECMKTDWTTTKDFWFLTTLSASLATFEVRLQHRLHSMIL